MSERVAETQYQLKRRTAVVSVAVPPLPYGSAVRIHRLFNLIDPAGYCLITSGDPDATSADGGYRLPVPLHRLPSEWRRFREPDLPGIRRVMREVNIWLKVAQRARNITRLLRAEGCRNVIAFTGDLEDMPAACLAASRCGCDFFPVVDDDYVYQWTDPVKRRFASRASRWIMRRSRCVLCISDACRDEMQRRYRVRTAVLRTPSPERGEQVPYSLRRPPEPLRLAFTGSVYRAGADALALVLRGLDRLGDIPATLVVSTSQSSAELDRLGLRGRIEILPPVGPAGIAARQAESDVLVLALGFHTGMPEVVRTSCPTKLSDYLVSGRPILCVAPAEAFITRYLKESGAAEIVDSEDPERVAEALRALSTDPARAASRVRAAWNLARRDGSPSSTVGGLVSLLNTGVWRES